VSGEAPQRDLWRDGVLVLVTSVVYAAWWLPLAVESLVGVLVVFLPLSGFAVVPLHLRLQRPRDSSVVDAFVTWLLSALLAGGWLALFG